MDSVSDQEKRRQEAINEVMYTERDFVRDMEYLRDACFSFQLIVIFTDVDFVGMDQWLERLGYYTAATTH